MKQTAVDWLFQELDNYYKMKSKFRSKKEILYQANAMFEEQIKDAYRKCYSPFNKIGDLDQDFDKYYNQTYKEDKQ